MSTINYDFDPGDTVYSIDARYGIRKAVVRTLRADVTPLSTTVTYTLQFVDSAQGSTTIDAADLYPDVDAALAAYRLMVE